MAVHVGVGWSGGGMSGVLAGFCGNEALSAYIPATTQVTTSTVSGGTLGYLLHRSTLTESAPGQRPVEFPPPYSRSLTLEQLNTNAASEGYTWWGNAINYIPNITTASMAARRSKAATMAARRRGGVAAASGPDDTTGWWQDVMRALFEIGYSVSEANVGAARGVGDWIVNAVAVRASACPLHRDELNVMVDAASSLRHVTLTSAAESSSPLTFWGANVTLGASQRPLSAIPAGAWSSCFFAAALMEDNAAYAAERLAEALGEGTLISTFAHVDDAAAERLYLADGGLLDTTGVVSLLRRGVTRILLNYINNEALAPTNQTQSELSSIAYLFGAHGVATDGQNALAGPTLSQVFPTALYEPVLTNLTTPGRLLARATRVPVLSNGYLGVTPYVLDELLIVSNALDPAFLAAFDDARIAKAVSWQWPDQMPVGFGTLEANLLCQYERWKLARHADTLESFFRGASS